MSTGKLARLPTCVQPQEPEGGTGSCPSQCGEESREITLGHENCDGHAQWTTANRAKGGAQCVPITVEPCSTSSARGPSCRRPFRRLILRVARFAKYRFHDGPEIVRQILVDLFRYLARALDHREPGAPHALAFWSNTANLVLSPRAQRCVPVRAFVFNVWRHPVTCRRRKLAGARRLGALTRRQEGELSSHR